MVDRFDSVDQRGLGVGQVRDELYWRDVEPTRGDFRLPDSYRQYLPRLEQAQVSPLLVLSFENPNYDGGETPYSEEGLSAYARYAVEVLRLGGKQVKAVEVWNEFNGTFNHGPATEHRAVSYVRMLRRAYESIKRERPDVIVVGGATSGVPLPYWSRMFAAGADDCLDALSVHPYRYDSPPEGLEEADHGS